MLVKKWNCQQGQEQAGKECLLHGLPPEGETHEIWVFQLQKTWIKGLPSHLKRFR